MKLLVGLGNPGGKYEATRHNVGFWWCNELAAQLAIVFEAQSKFFGDVSRVRMNGGDAWVLKPQTFMNESGRAVQSMCSFYGITASDILVVHDDLDLEPGVVKLKQSGGHGGHNGLRDIIQSLGNNKEFARLRIGIGHPGHASQVADYVLKKASGDDQQLITNSIDNALGYLPLVTDGQWEMAMNKLHSN